MELLPDFEKEDPSLQKVANNNGFCGCFRVSAKTGYNVNESMEYLIRNIIKRMEDLQNKNKKDNNRCFII